MDSGPEDTKVRELVQEARAKRRELQQVASRHARTQQHRITGKTYKPNGAREVARRQARLAAAA